MVNQNENVMAICFSNGKVLEEPSMTESSNMKENKDFGEKEMVMWSTQQG